MKRALASLCAVAAVTGAVATGCGRGTDTGARQDRPGPLTWQQELRVDDAQQRLTRQCMNRQGFSFWEDRSLTLRESMPVRYVQDDVEWARTYGYGGRIDARQERRRLHHPVVAYRKSLSPARRAAFDRALDGGNGFQVLSAKLPGSGREVRKRLGGCTAEAEKALYGDPGAWFRASKTATGLNALYADDLRHDRRLTAAVAAWSRCLEKAGLSYPDPQAARDAIRENTARLGPAGADRAFATERTTAVADARCARSTSLRSVATARETSYLDRLPDRYGEALDTYRRLQRQAYDRAVRIVPQRA
ncbi:hypothetical protein JCM4814A_22310 [Streptomyces phaeofaciens JCM 4814]|uniref:Lipoprotein n=1 Tax=Streptomyces phaeofaciens TaxID=68254 RepID=A0A918H553_9ACTN|nr:hypothetical protein [Streptomyces phaeofaciens]GGT34137.1 hypothetical protein GCM10010226_07660 [Streptomyces phaeofaciens]